MPVDPIDFSRQNEDHVFTAEMQRDIVLLVTHLQEYRTACATELAVEMLARVTARRERLDARRNRPKENDD